MKFYRGSAAAARAYVEADHARADDYYLAEGTGLAERYVATNTSVASTRPSQPTLVGGRADGTGSTTGQVWSGVERTGWEAERTGTVPAGEAFAPGSHGRPAGVRAAGVMDSASYESWVAGYDVESGRPKGRLRDDPNALRFVEVVVNGPKTWSILAALHPEIAAAYDAAQEGAAAEIIGWISEHATTRVGPRGLQVQVPVEEVEAAVIRHYTSRAGDPHRHLHLQINARVWAKGRWRGLHSVGVRDDIEAINGIGHAAVMCDPAFRQAVADHGYTLTEDGEVRELVDYVPAFSRRASQIKVNLDRYEADWRHDHPDEEPGPKLRQAWDRRAWAEARPDKPAPQTGGDLTGRWNRELAELGFQPHLPAHWEHTVTPGAASVGALDRDAAVELMLSRLGAKRSAWNAADIRGEAERIIATAGIVAEVGVRSELAEDLTARAITTCRPLLDGDAVPEHVRALTSDRVLEVEEQIIATLTHRARNRPMSWSPAPSGEEIAEVFDLDEQQREVAQAVAARVWPGEAGLVVVEGAAGAGKTTTLAAARHLLLDQGRRLVVLTPTKKAAQVAAREIGSGAYSAAWFIHQHGYRWDADGHWTHQPGTQPVDGARLGAGDVLLIDEAGMLDQDTAHALLKIADQAGAVLALVGDRHQLPAVGRGGVLDHAIARAAPEQCHTLERIHRFADPGYGDLTLKMRAGEDPESVFDQLVARGQILVHRSQAEQSAAIAHLVAQAPAGELPLVTVGTNDAARELNYLIRGYRHSGLTRNAPVVTNRGDPIGVGDRVITRRNDPTLKVANREDWTVTAINTERQEVLVTARGVQRRLPFDYVQTAVELGYVTTVHGAQGSTVPVAHLVVDENTNAAAAYVAMTRGRDTNIAHFHAESLQEARQQWAWVFGRNRADLGPFHAADRARDDINRYGTAHPRPRSPAPPRPTSTPTTQYGRPPTGSGIGR